MCVWLVSVGGGNGGGGRIVRIKTLLRLLPRRRNDPPLRMPQLLRSRTIHYSNRWWLLTIPPPTTRKGMPTRSNNSNTSSRIRVWWNIWWTICGLIKPNFFGCSCTDRSCATADTGDGGGSSRESSIYGDATWCFESAPDFSSWYSSFPFWYCFCAHNSTSPILHPRRRRSFSSYNPQNTVRTIHDETTIQECVMVKNLAIVVRL